jgi:hypothetical protein
MSLLKVALFPLGSYEFPVALEQPVMEDQRLSVLRLVNWALEKFEVKTSSFTTSPAFIKKSVPFYGGRCEALTGSMMSKLTLGQVNLGPTRARMG